MRKGILGSIAALAAGAGAAWGQPPEPLPLGPAGSPPPAAIGRAGEVVPVDGQLLPPGGLGALLPGARTPPAPVIMPPLAVGPQGDPQGLGPVAQHGPPPGPMWPPPGAYAAPPWQPTQPGITGAAAAGMGGGARPGSFGAAPHVWTDFEYLMYFAKSQPIHFPLVTTSAPSDQGLLGRPSTLVLIGQQDLAYNLINGGRVTFGFFGDCDRRCGFEASGWVLEQKSNITEIFSSPTGIPTLARPFRDTASPGQFSSLVIANPNFASGAVLVDTSTQAFSVEANAVWNLFRSEPGGKCAWSIDFLAGYRFIQVKEDLEINSQTNLNAFINIPTVVTGPFGQVTVTGSQTIGLPTPFGGVTITSPASVLIQDRFLVYNRFNGGQVGLRGEVRCGMWMFNAGGKLAIGNMHQRLEVTGASGFLDPSGGPRIGPPRAVGTAYGGLLATSTNIGTYNHDEFAVIPEFQGGVGLALARGVSVHIGYNFTYINRVARPGSQINPLVDSSTVPFSTNYGSTTRPAGIRALFAQDDFWLMGASFGFQFRY